MPHIEIGGPQCVFFARHAQVVPMPVITRAHGVHMWDEDDNAYMDVSSGPIVSNIGHGNAHVVEAMAEQAHTMCYAFPQVARNRPNMAYTERLAKLAGPGFERVCLASGGSEAMEAALRFVRQYAVATGKAAKRKIITLDPCYHGATLATLALNQDPSLETFLDGFTVGAEKVTAPFSYRLPGWHTPDSYALYCAEQLERKIVALGADTVLAFVMEPVGGLSSGCVVPPAAYFRAVRDICTRHGVFLIFDEVVSGMGRTGKFLAAHHWPDTLPDIVVMAKAMGAGYTPLGAMLAPAALVDELAETVGYPFAFSSFANPISCAVGSAILDEYDRLSLMTCAVRQGLKIRDGLKDIQSRSSVIGDIRGIGLLMAVEMVADQKTKASLPGDIGATERIRVHGLTNGLMIYARPAFGRRNGDWFIVAPPLTITDGECTDMLRRLEATITDFEAELRQRDVL